MAQDHQESIRAEIDEVNAAIAREGAEWVAGETSVLRLSHAERQSRLGFIPIGHPGGEVYCAGLCTYGGALSS